MARIRTVKPEFYTSEQVTDCSPVARLLFMGMWTFSDDNGIHPASIKRLKMEVFPSDDFTRQQIADMVSELITVGLVIEYTSHGETFWKITGWHHQKIDQPTFKYPLPDGSLPPNVRRTKFAESDSPNQDQRTLDERSPPEGKGEEGKGMERADFVLSPDGEQGQKVARHPANHLSDTVLAAYHEILPNCQRIAVLNPKRQRRIAAADKLARQVCRQQGWEYDPKEFWEAYFDQCADDEWLRGDRPNPNNPRWKQNLDVLLVEDRFAQIMDRAIAKMRDEERAA